MRPVPLRVKPVWAVLAMCLASSSVAALEAGPEEDQKTAAAENAAFALDLYGRLRATDDNLFFSPYSVSSALAMTYAGARGETARQMAEVMHLTLPTERLHPALAAIDSTVKSAGNTSDGQLHIASALWGQKGEGFLKEFLDLTAKHYGAGLRELDFIHATEAARATINTWVAEQTAQHIPELLQKDDLAADARLVLTNAIYFKAAWANPFEERRTKKGVFKLLDGKSVEAQLMEQGGQFQLAQLEDCSVLALPYKGKQLAMLIVLPKKDDGLPAIEKALTARTLDEWISKLKGETVHMQVPRFTTELRTDLGAALKSMGMPNAFTFNDTPQCADFSGMNGRHDLYISKVIHQARIGVNEQGTEAAAATAVSMAFGSAKPPTPVPFFADHPFLYVIRENQTGTILFIGRLMNPTP
jgi:serpin B